MARLLFYDYHNMVAILEKGEHNTDFHPMVDFLEVSPLRRNLKLRDEEGISSLPDAELFENLTLMGYNITSKQKFTFQKGQFSHQWKYLIHIIMQCLSPKSTRFNEFSSNIAIALGEGSGIPTEPHHTPSFDAQTPLHTTHPTSSLLPVTTTSIPIITPTETTPIRHYTRRIRIAQSSVPPTIADEPASPQRDVSQGEACPTDFGFLADQDRATIVKSSTLPYDSAPKVTSSAAVEGSMQHTIPELMALCTILQRKLSELTDKFQAQEVEINRLKERVKLLKEREGAVVTNFRDDTPIKGRSMDEGEPVIERVSGDTKEMATMLTSMDAATVLASGVVNVPTGSGSIPTASTPVEGSVPIGSEEVPTASPVFAIATMIAKELEEQLAREDQRRAKQIARDAEIARIHAEEELQSMIGGLDSNNETVAKYLEEYRQFSSELPMERRIELISNLVKYQDNYTKVKDFKGITFEEVEAKFNSVCKQMEDFIPMGSKEEAERIKRKEEVYMEALQVKHPIIDWGVHTKGHRAYWKITRLGGSPASYQFFTDLLKHLDREDLNQLWRLVKETLSTRPPTIDKEMELWVELSRLYEPDKEDQLWTHTQNFMHALVDWKLYDSCGVHHVAAKDKEIFMLGRIVGNKMHEAFPLLAIKFLLPEQLPTASEVGSHCQKKSEATAKKIALLY
nr:hypothetical protein [Tanacetum cinerariifolium]